MVTDSTTQANDLRILLRIPDQNDTDTVLDLITKYLPVVLEGKVNKSPNYLSFHIHTSIESQYTIQDEVTKVLRRLVRGKPKFFVMENYTTGYFTTHGLTSLQEGRTIRHGGLATQRRRENF